MSEDYHILHSVHGLCVCVCACVITSALSGYVPLMWCIEAVKCALACQQIIPIHISSGLPMAYPPPRGSSLNGRRPLKCKLVKTYKLIPACTAEVVSSIEVD